MYARVSKKGQVTIPKSIRERLKVQNEGGILFLVEGNEVKLKGIPGAQATVLAGSLKKYAKGSVPLSTIRKETQGKIANEIAKEGVPD
ncbi:MAG: AbrB/MazE/SpoVT family DNA-binding domain-containing protein [Thermodesulfobacteriota bacterium]|nr:AbrB/MazE/SpoVT family DNA-binding domain-containing protein [Thermodesulfobacteriota bacterium]